MKRVGADKALFARYRNELVMEPEARARALRGLQERFVRGELPSAGTNVAPPELARASVLSSLPVGWVAAGLTASVVLWASVSWLGSTSIFPDGSVSDPDPLTHSDGLPPTAAKTSERAASAQGGVADSNDRSQRLAGKSPPRLAKSSTRGSAPARAATGEELATKLRPALAADATREEQHGVTGSNTDGSLFAPPSAARPSSEQRPTAPGPVQDSANGNSRDEGNISATAGPKSAARPSSEQRSTATGRVRDSANRNSRDEGNSSATAGPKSAARPDADQRSLAAVPVQEAASGNKRDQQRVAERTPLRASEAADASTLAKEVQLLQAAQGALRSGDTRRALALLAEHTWTFPRGHLTEARDVARIIALCQAGHVSQSQAAAKRFLQQRPDSPFAMRVRASADCKAEVKNETFPSAD